MNETQLIEESRYYLSIERDNRTFIYLGKNLNPTSEYFIYFFGGREDNGRLVILGAARRAFEFNGQKIIMPDGDEVGTYSNPQIKGRGKFSLSDLDIILRRYGI